MRNSRARVDTLNVGDMLRSGYTRKVEWVVITELEATSLNDKPAIRVHTSDGGKLRCGLGDTLPCIRTGRGK